MDSLNLDALPKNKTRYNWEESVNLVLDYELDNINYKLKIINKQNNILTIKPLGFFNDYTFDINI